MELVREVEAVIKQKDEDQSGKKGLEFRSEAAADVVLLQGFWKIGNGLKRMRDDFIV
jgi:hypothetical protein